MLKRSETHKMGKKYKNHYEEDEEEFSDDEEFNFEPADFSDDFDDKY